MTDGEPWRIKVNVKKVYKSERQRSSMLVLEEGFLVLAHSRPLPLLKSLVEQEERERQEKLTVPNYRRTQTWGLSKRDTQTIINISSTICPPKIGEILEGG